MGKENIGGLPEDGEPLSQDEEEILEGIERQLETPLGTAWEFVRTPVLVSTATVLAVLSIAGLLILAEGIPPSPDPSHIESPNSPPQPLPDQPASTSYPMPGTVGPPTPSTSPSASMSLGEATIVIRHLKPSDIVADLYVGHGFALEEISHSALRAG